MSRRPPLIVHHWLSDHAHELEWHIKMKGIQKLTDEPIGVGALVQDGIHLGPPIISECVRFERSRVWEMIDWSRGPDVWLERLGGTKGDGAHLVLRMEIQLHWLGFAATVLRRRMRPELEREIATIRRRCNEPNGLPWTHRKPPTCSVDERRIRWSGSCLAGAHGDIDFNAYTLR